MPISPRKKIASSKSYSSGLPKKSYSNTSDGDGAPAPKSDVTKHYDKSDKLGKASSGGESTS